MNAFRSAVRRFASKSESTLEQKLRRARTEEFEGASLSLNAFLRLKDALYEYSDELNDAGRPDMASVVDKTEKDARALQDQMRSKIDGLRDNPPRAESRRPRSTLESKLRAVREGDDPFYADSISGLNAAVAAVADARKQIQQSRMNTSRSMADHGDRDLDAADGALVQADRELKKAIARYTAQSQG